MTKYSIHRFYASADISLSIPSNYGSQGLPNQLLLCTAHSAPHQGYSGSGFSFKEMSLCAEKCSMYEQGRGSWEAHRLLQALPGNLSVLCALPPCSEHVRKQTVAIDDEGWVVCLMPTCRLGMRLCPEIESQSQLAWKSPSRSSSPTVSPGVRSKSQNCQVHATYQWIGWQPSGTRAD